MLKENKKEVQVQFHSILHSPFHVSSTHKTHIETPHARGKSCINDELTVTDVKPLCAALSPDAADMIDQASYHVKHTHKLPEEDGFLLLTSREVLCAIPDQVTQSAFSPYTNANLFLAFW
jgi:hypothetical protein